MARKPSKPPKPTAAELDLLRTIWRTGPATVKETHQVLQKDRPSITCISRSTVAVVLGGRAGDDQNHPAPAGGGRGRAPPPAARQLHNHGCDPLEAALERRPVLQVERLAQPFADRRRPSAPASVAERLVPRLHVVQPGRKQERQRAADQHVPHPAAQLPVQPLHRRRVQQAPLLRLQLAGKNYDVASLAVAWPRSSIKLAKRWHWRSAGVNHGYWKPT